MIIWACEREREGVRDKDGIRLFNQKVHLILVVILISEIKTQLISLLMDIYIKSNLYMYTFI